MTWSLGRDDTSAEAALKDIATLLEGPAKESISTTDQAEAYAERGAIQFARGRTVEARAAFADALKVDARNVSALIGQGDVFYDEGRFTEAISRYDTAKQVDPNSVPAITGAAKTQIALERLADAKTQLADAVKRFPKSPLAMRWLGASEATLGNKKDAEKDFLAAIALVDPKDPDAIEPYAAYANFLSAQGRADEAQAKLGEAQKLLPDSAGLERTLGDVGVAQGHFDDAIARYNEAMKRDPLDVTTRFRLGQALRKTNQADAASKVFDGVYASDKNYPGLALERGPPLRAIRRCGQGARAVQGGACEGAHGSRPHAARRRGAGGDREARRGAPQPEVGAPAAPEQRRGGALRGARADAPGGAHQQEAMRHLQAAVNHDPNRPEYHLYVGWLANEIIPPSWGSPRRRSLRALELDKTLADGYWQRGVLEYLAGAYDDAVKDLQHALELKPTRYEAHATLAEVYEHKNQPGMSIAEWNIAFARDDQNEKWNYEFGKLLLDNGQIGEAAKHLKLATELAEKDQPRPGWLKVAEFPTAEALRQGRRQGRRDRALQRLRPAERSEQPRHPRRAARAHRPRGALPRRALAPSAAARASSAAAARA